MAVSENADSFLSSKYIYSICSGTKSQSGVAISSYLGTGFLINDQGYLATCKHVIEKANPGESIFACPDNSRPYAIKEIRCHETMDFAVIKLDINLPSNFLTITDCELVAGVDVIGYGSIHVVSLDGRNEVKGHLFSGNIVRRWNSPEVPRTRSVCALSFPVISGMSGGPLLVKGEKTPTVCGMLVGNTESSITIFKLEEREEGGQRYTERVDRVVELGCAHSAQDILQFMSDMNL